MAKKKRLSTLKSIRAFCRDCTCNHYSMIKYCANKNCKLWYYRMGSNPRRKEIGGVPTQRKWKLNKTITQIRCFFGRKEIKVKD